MRRLTLLARMARSGVGGFLVLLVVALICSVSSSASISYPISDSHRSAALELFTPIGGSFGSLEEAYEALRTFEVLGIDKKPDISVPACHSVLETLGSSSAVSKDIFYALKVNGILKCEVNEDVLEGIVSNLQTAVSSASSLLDFYHSIGSLVLIKDQSSKDVSFEDAEGVFRSIKALSQSDGRWRYSFNNPESSTFAAGLALEALAGVISVSSSEIDQSLIATTKNDILKLFDSIEKYDDGAFYFDEKHAQENQGPLSTTSSVVRGLTAFADVTSGNLNLPSEKFVGLAKFLLGIGIPGDAKDLFNQVDSLAYLESNRISIPLILSLPATVLSLTKKDTLKVKVNTVLGSNAPPLTVNLVRVFSSGSKDTSIIENQELKYDTENSVYFLDALPKSVDVGNYIFVFETVFHDAAHEKVYTTGGQTQVPIFVTGVIKVDSAGIDVLESDLGIVETQRKLDLAGENLVSLSANHLQKLRLSFQLTTPLGHAFKPHQAILKLRHETKVEHIFVVANSGKKFEIVLDLLGLVERFFYLSGSYTIQLTVGDAVMENSFLKVIGHVDLDLPEAPENAPRPPPQPVEPYSRYGPKAEITHIFRAPEKLPPKELSLTFLGLTLLPFIGFLVGLLRLGVNLKNFPSSAVSATFAFLFHFGIAAVLFLYVLFWLKLDLFTTMKTLGFLGVFLMFVGHRILSHLASTSSKLKSA
ncbi:dolichyl-diphosphooligosaccharide--protein glycosyltransferase subunit 2 isoform X2 [Ricinus communis]|uniref:dolichyl-diphosphooligosaccharide--protein glycosyltransferase subunit 2 isoform X2 n=1 Tax=Ricinus communis TaxID=3988 RepID=UPI00201A2CC8|nr:dolichyl-diphosphooligosaccharide--protein glycosyltransferase subunit 2 isoform X2 [Ricinus communis]